MDEGEGGHRTVDAVREVMADVLGVGVDAIAPDAALGALPNADSMRLMLTVMRLEQRFGVELPDSGFDPAWTALRLARLVEGKRP
jgi:acyl carrier protein